MPMIPKPMTDINSESAYEKLKFIPEHYNEIMAAYTDIMEHLKLPVMNETGGSGEECLHETTTVTNPCPAYVQFVFNTYVPLTGFYYVYKDSYGDYDVVKIDDDTTSGICSGLRNVITKYNEMYLENSIDPDISYHDSLNDYKLIPSPSNSNPDLVYAAMLVDKTTGEPVENVDIYTDIDGISGSETTYTDLTNVYDIKLVLAHPNDYSFTPIILGDLFEQLVELRANSIDLSIKFPTPKELLKLLTVTLGSRKLNISLLTAEERARVRNNLNMNMYDLPEDTPYMYAIDLFCHPDTVHKIKSVSLGCAGTYSKGYISFNTDADYGLTNVSCDGYTYATYVCIFMDIESIAHSESYIDCHEFSTSKQSGVTITPYTFKLIQSKEGIDRRL